MPRRRPLAASPRWTCCARGWSPNWPSASSTMPSSRGRRSWTCWSPARWRRIWAAAKPFPMPVSRAIDAGAIPILREGTAMAGSCPELRHLAFDEDMRSTRELQRKTGMIAKTPAGSPAPSAHCEATLRPTSWRRGLPTSMPARLSASADTGFIPPPGATSGGRHVHPDPGHGNDDAAAEPTLASVAAQTVQPPR